MSHFGFQKENLYGQKKRSEFILNELDNLTKNHPDLKILDFGCGTGEMITLPIAENGYKITGMDLDPQSIYHANKINPFSNAVFICANILNYNTENRYDVIICSEVLEHLENPETVLFALTKLLNSEGIIIITIPNGMGPFEVEQFLLKSLLAVFPSLKETKKKMMLKEIEKRGIMMTENLESEHIQFFTMKKFQKLTQSCNLLIEKGEKSCFIAGPFSNQIFKNFPSIININVNKITRYLPFRLCSGWYFITRKM